MTSNAIISDDDHWRLFKCVHLELHLGPLVSKRTVRILLECFLISTCDVLCHFFTYVHGVINFAQKESSLFTDRECFMCYTA